MDGYNQGFNNTNVSHDAIFFLLKPLVNHIYRCAVPGYPNDTYNILGEHHRALVEAAMGSDRDCKIYSGFNISDPPSYGNESSEYNRTEKCHRWVYGKSEFSSSINTEVLLPVTIYIPCRWFLIIAINIILTHSPCGA